MRTKVWGRRLLVATLLAPALAACQQTRSDPGPGLVASAPAAVAPTGVPITMEIGETSPEPVRLALASELSDAAGDRGIDVVDRGVPARYHLVGHLSIDRTDEAKPSLAVVWEVVDPGRRRAGRITGSSPIRSVAQNSWDGLDREALRRLAGESMDGIASFLTAGASGPKDRDTTAIAAGELAYN